MPFHIKKPGLISSGDVYYKGDGDQWTDTYATRKVYTNESDADAQVTQPTKMINGFPYKNGAFIGASVVSE